MRVLKIVDWERRGNVVRFYLGDVGCVDYWGDDWNDAPYEHNAGLVYDEFVRGHADVAFPYDTVVSEPCDGVVNSEWSKEDMKNQRVPMLAVMDCGDEDDFSYWKYDRFSDVVSDSRAVRVYMGCVLDLEAPEKVFGDSAHVIQAVL